MGFLLIGVLVGTIVGVNEGPVALKVGDLDGSTVGCDDGCRLGFGSGVGFDDGLALDTAVGSGVGCDDGTLVGAAVRINISVGCDDGLFSKTLNRSSIFVVAFPLKSIIEIVVVVSFDDP